ncbi:MAG: cell division protein ZapA [Thermoanaerobaculia bacterium]
MTDVTPGPSTEVEIFGATYAIRGGHDPAHLTALAAEVDRRMRDLAAHGSTADAGKLAILVALNLADELSRNREQSDGERGEIETKVAELTEELVAALAGS